MILSSRPAGAAAHYFIVIHGTKSYAAGAQPLEFRLERGVVSISTTRATPMAFGLTQTGGASFGAAGAGVSAVAELPAGAAGRIEPVVSSPPMARPQMPTATWPTLSLALRLPALIVPSELGRATMWKSSIQRIRRHKP